MTKKITISITDWQAWLQEGWTQLPLIAEIDWQEGLPTEWTEAWQTASPYSFVLESGKEGRYTYLGLSPAAVLTGKDEEGKWNELDSGTEGTLTGPPLEVLEAWMASFKAPRLQQFPFFHGGFAGFLAYDVARSLERLPVSAADDTGLPDYLWLRMDEVWIYDHEERKLYCAIHIPVSDDLQENQQAVQGLLPVLFHEAEQHAERMLKLWTDLFQSPSGDLRKAIRLDRLRSDRDAGGHAGPEDWEAAFPQDQFERAVQRIREYIGQGDVFQVNLSLRQQRRLMAAPEDVYEWLRLLNPSPYMGLLRTPAFTLASGSPELLVKLDGGRVTARPIAGTRRRGRTPAEDRAMAEELLSSEKERAEHIMLVDLERNDIGRIAEYGTVHVPELMTVEYYSHVMHLVSQVEGRLAQGRNAIDVIAAVFPGGTITGAPKVRTMEIIEELEPVRRGPYTGSMGWIDYNGDMELNIIIRTLAVKDGMSYIQAGAGIVIDSDPYREYKESRNKAKAVMKAVQYCEEETALSKRNEQEEDGT
ncbi:anthranilate synthase component I family protein [Paenibacillus sp. P96]|uniref:Anthranilate synthase component I family protein n=1 Tax=Paenibacillus zeirhizosphaerae TaxID=2987519 RepID=A0ABT9FWU9_9BACL|nr:anthranilate synthase component I family protein [Paenibacillus sp. P96]MDP4099203.1 anthranilate synthase component I family protein [Paenibacillus sp. P96]